MSGSGRRSWRRKRMSNTGRNEGFTVNSGIDALVRN